MMKLGASWKRVLRTAWSVRLAALSGLLSALELIAPYFAFAMPQGVFAALAIATSIGASVARVVVQEGVQ